MGQDFLKGELERNGKPLTAKLQTSNKKGPDRAFLRNHFRFGGGGGDFGGGVRITSRSVVLGCLSAKRSVVN